MSARHLRQPRMYHQHFGLNEAPFSIAVNPRYLFMSQRHRDALAHLLYGVSGGGGFILLTGEVGTGKTTVNRCLLEQLPDTTDLAIILNPALSATELLASACDELHIEYPKDTQSLKALTDALHRYLLDNYDRGRKTVLMIDEAQHLDFDVLEQIRLLTNLETNDEKLLQIILIGQPELSDKLSRPELRQLNQRITARYNLQPLNLDETSAYIRHRLEVAGLKGDRRLFEQSAVKQVHALTRGIPRLINVLCDRALLGAYGQKQGSVTRALVRSAAREVFGESHSEQQPVAAMKRWWGLVAILVVVCTALVSVGKFPVDYPKRAAGEGEVSAPVVSDSETTEESPQAMQAPVPPKWEFIESDGLAKLWLAATDLPSPSSLCPPPEITRLSCSTGTARVWNELASLNRPVLLETVTKEKFIASVLVFRIEGSEAIVWTDQGLQWILLADIADAWTGTYRFLWQAPAAWEGELSLGDAGAVVREIAQMFSTLDGMELEEVASFGPALEARIRLFQQGENLPVDGHMTQLTLLRLNDRLGIGLTVNRALARAQNWQGVR
jgi:general secretion pathway protein A